MSNPPISQPYFSREIVEQDLFNTLLLSEETMPWSVMDIDPTASDLDSAHEWCDIEAVLSPGCQTFFSSLDAFWKSQAEPSTPLLTNLVNRLGAKLPQAILSEIAHKAQQSVSQSKSDIDAAILCVQGLLPQWSLDDLLVFNRPFSYAMRGEPIGVERVLRTLDSCTWDELSDFDQARVCLAIAHYALRQAQES
jgi:hypothetical protein